MDYKNFKHKITEKVKFHEVDIMGVVNNAIYFNYFEDARLNYLQGLKDNYKLEKIMEKDSFFIMAHNEVDYLLPAEFEDELIIYTKIEWIKNSSISFKHVVINKQNDKTVAIGSGVMVHIKLSTRKKQKLPSSFIAAIREYEE